MQCTVISNVGDKTENYEEYALYGGMPLVLFRKTEDDKFKYLSSLFEEVYFKDIIERYQVGLPEVLSELTDDLCSSVGSLTNAAKIANTLQSVKGIKVDGGIIASYLIYLSESFLFCQAKRYDVKGKKYFSYPSKYYCSDIGLRNVRLNLQQQEETHIMENIMYNELVCRGYSVSALSLDNPQKEKTELRPLHGVKGFFRKILVTKSGMKPWFDEEGILRLGLYEFLLNPDALDL